MDIKWIAEYDDGTLLEQFDVSGKEHLFKEINHDKLVKFTLKSDKHTISVYPITGDIEVDGVFFKYEKFRTHTKFDIIYFIRRIVDFGPSGKSMKSIWNIGLKNRGEANKVPSYKFLVRNNNEDLSIDTK